MVRLALVREATISTAWDRHVRDAKDVAELMEPLAAGAGLEREVFWTLLLDGKNRVRGLHVLSVGSLTAALIHPREWAKALIIGNAAATIMCHFHPSGDPTPSAEDLALTKRLCEVGDLIGIRVLDHIVLGHDGAFRSLAEEGVLGGAR
jgi:DNA repair protein RadC